MSVDFQRGESRGCWRQQDPGLWFKPTDHEVTSAIKRPYKISEYRRSTTMDLLPGESRGYWKHQTPAKSTGMIHNEKAVLFFDTGAEVSIVDTIFVRKVGCNIDSSRIQDCVGIGDNVYRTEGRTRIKVTLAGSLVYFSDIWVRDLTGQQAILGMDFMAPAGIHLDLAHGSISLQDEVRLQLSGKWRLYSDKAKIVNVGQYFRIQARKSVKLPLRLRSSIHDKLSMDADNIQWTRENEVDLDHKHRGQGVDPASSQRIVIWRTEDHVPRITSFISIGSRRYMERQNLAVEATTDARSGDMEIKVQLVPAVERYEYETPRAILQKTKTAWIKCRNVETSQDQDVPGWLPSDNSPSEIRPLDLASVVSEKSDLSSIEDRDSVSHLVTVKETLDDLYQVTPDAWATDPSLEETTSAVETREEGGRYGIRVPNQDQLHLRCQDQGSSPSKCGGSDP
ncbi:hypothetical protein PHMEG_0005337 [Phytophthora megakarya]|uniref:Peptidase A2 domain-containing protein n=1 Tax=Phytophthora megakarya TaxID=4795 RepID=A0A225WRJ1_9STRA|nr:hypothetical protein PHMEG_0005337 [Phytophthora megakarya]